METERPIETLRRAYEEAKARFEAYVEEQCRRFAATDPEATQLYADMVAAERRGDKAAYKQALAVWHTKFFEKAVRFSDGDEEQARLLRERDAAWDALGAAMRTDEEDDEGDEE